MCMFRFPVLNKLTSVLPLKKFTHTHKYTKIRTKHFFKGFVLLSSNSMYK